MAHPAGPRKKAVKRLWWCGGGQSDLTKRLHCHCTWMVQSYLPGGANVHMNLRRASMGQLSPHLKWHLNQLSHFHTAHSTESQYSTTSYPLLPQNSLFTCGDLERIQYSSLDPPESTPQTASRSVQPFCRAHNCEIVTRLTDKPICPQCFDDVGRPAVRASGL